MTVSLCYTAEVDTTLKSNYILIKIKKNKNPQNISMFKIPKKKKKKAKTKPKTLKSCQMSKLRNKKDYLSLVVGRGKWPLICP